MSPGSTWVPFEIRPYCCAYGLEVYARAHSRGQESRDVFGQAFPRKPSCSRVNKGMACSDSAIREQQGAQLLKVYRESLRQVVELIEEGNLKGQIRIVGVLH